MLLTAVWALVFVLRNLPIIRFEPLESEVLWFLLSCYLGFTLCHTIFSLPLMRHRRIAARESIPIDAIVRVTMAFALIGLVGAAIRGVDIYFGRGLDFSQGISAARLQNIAQVEVGGSGQSALSGLARIFTAFASIAAMVVVLRWEQFPLAKAKKVMVIFALVICESILEGGRNTIAVNLLLVGGCTLVRLRRRKVPLPGGRRLKRFVLIALTVAPVFFAYVFVERFDALGHTSSAAFDALERVFNVEFSPALTDWDSDLGIGLSTSVAGIAIYMTHAVGELGWLLQWSANNGPEYGAYNFALVTVSLERLGFENLNFDPLRLTRIGLYMTAMGELVIDLGVGGTIAMCAALGALYGSWWRKVRYGTTIGAELALAIGATALLVSPLYSVVPGFLGTLVAAAMFVLLVKARAPRRRPL